MPFSFLLTEISLSGDLIRIKSLQEINQAGSSHCILHEKEKAWSRQKLEKECHTKWEIYLNTTLKINEVEGDIPVL